MLSVISSTAFRATMLAAAVAILLRALRIRDPRMRHSIWTGFVGVMLLLPVAIAWGPRTIVPLLGPESWQGAVLTRVPLAPTRYLPQQSSMRAKGPDAAERGDWDWKSVAAVTYLAGVAIALLRLAIGILRMRHLRRDAVLERGNLVNTGCASPLTVGLLRPDVILPTAWSLWPQEKMNAILHHEREHICRDPLIQCLVLINRSIFWFHPLSWWLKREISNLSEEACDAAVIARGFDRHRYAEYLLDLARAVADAGTRARSLDVAAVGSNLPSRIRSILAPPPPDSVARLRLAFVVLVCTAFAITLATGSLAHAQLASPAFEVASIKVSRSSDAGGGSKFEGPYYKGTNVPLRRIIRLAYAPIQDFVGGAGWLDSERFDVLAKAAGPQTQEQLQMMLRSLLAERFHLVVHKETRNRPAYALLMVRPDAKLGPSLRRSETDCSPANRKNAPKGACGFRSGAGAVSGHGATMEQLAAELILTGRLVVDRTGLTGTYDFDLRWTPDELETNAELLTALREQLGLKLEAIRTPVEVIVIDKAERPSEN